MSEGILSARGPLNAARLRWPPSGSALTEAAEEGGRRGAGQAGPARESGTERAVEMSISRRRKSWRSLKRSPAKRSPAHRDKVGAGPEIGGAGGVGRGSGGPIRAFVAPGGAAKTPGREGFL